MKKRDPLGNPFSPEVRLDGHGPCKHPEHAHAGACDDSVHRGEGNSDLSREQLIDRVVESAVVRALFGHDDLRRRAFLGLVGKGTFAAALASVFPLAACKDAVKEELPQETAAGDPVKPKNPLEKTKLKVGFVPITCATPIIMAHPMGFYKKYGLDVDVLKTAGWAVARDKSISREYDASHMLTPMPLAITMGAGSTAMPFFMPAVENINGQAITLHIKHKDKRDPKQWNGFKFAVPFDYSMDPDSHRAVDEGAAFLAEGMDDALIQLVHGEPDPSRSAQYVTTVQTVCANGMFARGVEVGVQLAQHAEKVTGGPTLFGVNVTGAYGSVGWITPHATIGDLESAQQALMADPDWLAMVDRDAGSAYAADPAASSQTVWRNLA
jgi:hypothetical protein